MESYLQHHGILGQKWGIRRFQNEDGSLTDAGKKRLGYSSTGLRASIAKRQNEKVDKSFQKWKVESAKKANAVELGKKANLAKRAYESGEIDKKTYKQANKEYKKALRSNTTYRKGQIKSEVESDLSRKYLSSAKKIEKQLRKDPSNKTLQKQYNDLMSKHDIERAKARRAPSVAANRSRFEAGIKRTATITIKTAAIMTATTVGITAVNSYMKNGKINISAPELINTVNQGRRIVTRMAGFVY